MTQQPAPKSTGAPAATIASLTWERIGFIIGRRPVVPIE